MKGLLINSKERTITEVEVREEHLMKDIYKHLNCETITMAPIHQECFGVSEGQNVCYVDDEGLLKEGQKPYFNMTNCHGPVQGGIAGNGLILGVGKSGSETDHTMNIYALKKDVNYGICL